MARGRRARSASVGPEGGGPRTQRKGAAGAAAKKRAGKKKSKVLGSLSQRLALASSQATQEKAAPGVPAGRFFGSALPRPFLVLEGPSGLWSRGGPEGAKPREAPPAVNDALLAWAALAPRSRGGFAVGLRQVGAVAGTVTGRGGKPKRPLTAYFLYANDVREAVKAEHPEIAKRVAEVAKEIAKRWKTLDEAAKLPYVEKAKELRSAYKAATAPPELEDEDEDEEALGPGTPLAAKAKAKAKAAGAKQKRKTGKSKATQAKAKAKAVPVTRPQLKKAKKVKAKVGGKSRSKAAALARQQRAAGKPPAAAATRRVTRARAGQ